MQRTTQQHRPERNEGRDGREAPPIWRNTRPRGNPEPNRHDLERSMARMEAVLGR